MKKRSKLPRCPLCGAVMHVTLVENMKMYRCGNYEKTGCAAMMMHPDSKRKNRYW